MFYEFKQVVSLKAAGASDKEIRTKVLEDNLFQHTKQSSIRRGLPSIIRRANVLDEILRRFVIEESFDVGKVINLYAIMKTDCLFFEFMDEVIAEKLKANDYSFEKKDINMYFTVKAEQDGNIAGWTETTIQKLKQVYKKILLETGLIKDKKSGELNQLLIDERVKAHLIHIGEKQYVRAMGE